MKARLQVLNAKIKEHWPYAIIAMIVVGYLAYFGPKLLGKKEAATEITSVEDTLSYVLGNQIGTNLKRQGIAKIDAKVLAEAVEDGFNGLNKVSAADAQKAMQALQKSMVDKNQAEASNKLRESQQFLTANKAKAGVKTTASGLQYMVLQEGKGKAVKKDSVVKMNYSMALTNGAVLDSTYQRKAPSKQKLQDLVKGWQEGLLLTKEGGKIRLYIPPELGYGPAPTSRIPGNSTLIIEVEVLSVE